MFYLIEKFHDEPNMCGSVYITKQTSADVSLHIFLGVAMIAPPCRPVGTGDTAVTLTVEIKANGKRQFTRSFAARRKEHGLCFFTARAAGQVG